jgi:hypothetical protein
MKRVSKSALKAKMFEYFRELQEQGGELINPARVIFEQNHSQ